MCVCIASFLEKHFSNCIMPIERDSIIKDFPQCNCQALQVPKLAFDLPSSKGHFGVEKLMYELHGQILDMMTCL